LKIFAGQQGVTLAVLILLQAFCVFFFVSDLAVELISHHSSVLAWHNLMEIVANVGLIAGILVEARLLADMSRRQATAETALAAASGAMGDKIEQHFRDWGLTRTEADIALFTIKGFSISEIAGLRGSAEGTVKSHLNAIYRKAGIQGRTQLTSMLIEDLMRKPLVGATE
jgi:DNA-binding CsgD family transcriptional regulator